jgi:flavin-binding protein dodecin
VDQINLPQTAVVLANNLALGRYKDINLINADKNYGYAAFDEMLHMRAVEKSSKRSLEYFDVMLTKGMLARAKKESYRSDIVRSFEKLLNQV